MKKVLTILLCVTIVLSLGACSANNHYEDQLNNVEESKKMSDIISDYTSELHDKYGTIPAIFTSDDTSIFCTVTPKQFKMDDLKIDAWTMICELNSILGFGKSLELKMKNTRPLDGTLTDENDKYKVTWSYSGGELNIIYEMK